MVRIQKCNLDIHVDGSRVNCECFDVLPPSGSGARKVFLHQEPYEASALLPWNEFVEVSPAHCQTLLRLGTRFRVSSTVRRYYSWDHALVVQSTYAHDPFVVIQRPPELRVFASTWVLYGILCDLLYTAASVCPIHAGAVVDGVGAHVFVGEMNAGKTMSILSRLLSGHDFLANDCIALTEKGVSAVVERVVPVNADCTEHYPKLRPILRAPRLLEEMRSHFDVDELVELCGVRRVRGPCDARVSYLGMTRESGKHPIDGIRYLFPSLIRHSMWCHELVGADLGHLERAIAHTYELLRALPCVEA